MLLSILCITLLLFSTTLQAADLNPSSFRENVLLDERVWLVHFYSKLCHVCAAFAPTWEKIESKVTHTITYPTTAYLFPLR